MAVGETFRCEHHAPRLEYRFLGSRENGRAKRIYGGDDQDIRFALMCLDRPVNLPRIRNRWTATVPRVFYMPGAMHPVPIDNLGSNRKHLVFEREGRMPVVLRFETRIPLGLVGAIRRVFEARFDTDSSATAEVAPSEEAA